MPTVQFEARNAITSHGNSLHDSSESNANLRILRNTCPEFVNVSGVENSNHFDELRLLLPEKPYVEISARQTVPRGGSTVENVGVDHLRCGIFEPNTVSIGIFASLPAAHASLVWRQVVGSSCPSSGPGVGHRCEEPGFRRGRSSGRNPRRTRREARRY